MDVAELTIPAADWASTCTALRAGGARMLDLLTAVDDPGAGLIQVLAHVVDVPGRRRWLLVTQVARERPTLDSVAEIWPGAGWHEREVHEMFGVDFPGNPDLSPLLTDGYAGWPLRRTTALPARVQTPWPGAKDPADRPPAGATTRVAARPRARLAPPGTPPEWSAASRDREGEGR